jgi:hypothetical protein
LLFKGNIAGLLDRVRSAKVFGVEGVFDAINVIEGDPNLEPKERDRLTSAILSHIAVETFFDSEADKWANRMNGEESRYNSKPEAIAAGRVEAQRRHLEHVIRNREGRIVERNSFVGDPWGPRSSWTIV